jgi:hypothetical protein
MSTKLRPVHGFHGARRDPELSIGLKKTDAIERHVGNELDQPGYKLAGVNHQWDGRSRPHCLNPFTHRDLGAFSRGHHLRIAT